MFTEKVLQDTQSVCCNHIKFKQIGLSIQKIVQKVDGMANNVDTDQTAPKAV